MLRAVASAPGKAILFGEHSVVYGTYAVAGALSDMRIFAETCVTNVDKEAGSMSIDNHERILRIIFMDIIDNSTGKSKGVTVSFERIAALVSMQEDACDVRGPTEAERIALDSEYQHLEHQVAQALASIIYLAGKIFSAVVHSSNSRVAEITVTVKSNGLPLGAGLGSSAAFSVAVAASFLNMRAKLNDPTLWYSSPCPCNSQLTVFLPSSNSSATDTLIDFGENDSEVDTARKIVNDWAFASETLLHGAPSGLDNTTSCFGGLVQFRKQIGTVSGKDGDRLFDSIPDAPAIHILLVNTKVPRSTKKLVGAVRGLYDKHTDIVEPLLAVINKITEKFISLIERTKDADLSYGKFVEQMGELMKINHHLLCSLGVGHSALTKVVEAAELLGLPCKLTGAGGGGCAIVLSPNHTSSEDDAADEVGGEERRKIDSLIYELRSCGFDVHRTAIGGDGFHLYV